MSGTKSIVHDQEQSRFVIYVDDQEAGFAEYSQEGNVRDSTTPWWIQRSVARGYPSR